MAIPSTQWTTIHIGLLIAAIGSVAALNAVGGKLYQSIAPVISLLWLVAAPVVGIIALRASKRAQKAGQLILNAILLLIWLLAAYASQLHWSLPTS